MILLELQGFNQPLNIEGVSSAILLEWTRRREAIARAMDGLGVTEITPETLAEYGGDLVNITKFYLGWRFL